MDYNQGPVVQLLPLCYQTTVTSYITGPPVTHYPNLVCKISVLVN